MIVAPFMVVAPSIFTVPPTDNLAFNERSLLVSTPEWPVGPVAPSAPVSPLVPVIP